MLLRQQCRRHQHRHLLAVAGGDECGAQCDLGLAKADIAANEPVHHPGALHIGKHGGNGRLLIGRFLEWEGRAELRVTAIFGVETETLSRFAASVDLQ